MIRRFVFLSLTLVLVLAPSAGNLYITENGIDFSDASDPFIEGITIDNIQENQTLTINSSGINDRIGITEGSTVEIEDNFEGNTDNQSISVSGRQLVLENGGSLLVPYANNSDKIDGVELGDISWSDIEISREDLSVSDLGSADSDLMMNSYRIEGLSDPVNAQDAATRSWVLSTEVDTNASVSCGSGEVLVGGIGCVSRYSVSDDGDSSSSNEIQNISASGDSITIYRGTSGDEIIGTVSVDDDVNDSIVDNLGPVDSESEFESFFFDVVTPSEDRDTNASTECSDAEFLAGNGSCLSDSFEADTTIAKWGISSEYLLNDSGALIVDESRLNSTIDQRDDFEADTVNANQTISVVNNSQGVNDLIRLSDGGEALIQDDNGTVIKKWSIGSEYLVNDSGTLRLDEVAINSTIDQRDDFEPDTNASTECSSGEVLTGSGCVSRYSVSDDGDSSSSNEIQNISASGDSITIYQSTSGSNVVGTVSIDDNTDDVITDNLGPVDSESEFESFFFDVVTPSEDRDTNASVSCGSGEVLVGGMGCVSRYSVSDDGDTSTGNENVNSLTFNSGNGVLTLGQDSAGDVVVDLDGRYIVSDSTDSDSDSEDQVLTNPAEDTVGITDGNGSEISTVKINDDNGTDNQNLSFVEDVSGTSDRIEITGGTDILIDDDYEANTDASTKCSSSQVLTGAGCVSRYTASDDGDTSSSNEIQGVDDVLSEDGAADGRGTELDMSKGELVVPTGDVY